MLMSFEAVLGNDIKSYKGTPSIDEGFVPISTVIEIENIDEKFSLYETFLQKLKNLFPNLKIVDGWIKPIAEPEY